MKEDHANMPGMDHKTMKPEQGKVAAPAKAAPPQKRDAPQPGKAEQPRAPGKS